jgi:hypothetical protein
MTGTRRAEVSVGMTALTPSNARIGPAILPNLPLRGVGINENAFPVALDPTTSAVGRWVIALPHQTTTPQKPEQDAG